TIDFDPNLIIPDKSKSLADGAIAPWCTTKYRAHHGEMIRAAKAANIPTNVPWYDLAEYQQRFIEEGDDKFPGIRGFFAALERKKYKLHVRVFLSKYRGYALCPDCRGARLRKEALYVRIGGRNLGELVKMNIEEAFAFFGGLELSPEESAIADKILIEIRQRLKFLN